MSELRELILAEPIFDTHEHQIGFVKLDEQLSQLDRRALCGYLPHDLQLARGVGDVLESKVESGEYDARTAQSVARRLLSENALALYRMDGEEWNQT